MDKFQREYRLIADASNGGDPVVMRPPLTLEFDLVRNILASANTATFRVVNLAPDSRNAIYKDRYDYSYRGIELQAGYGDVMPRIFKGNMKLSNSVRQMGTGMVTTIEAFDGGFALVNSDISKSYGAGTLNQVALEDVLGHLQGVEVGTVGKFPGTLGRGASLFGSPADHARTLSNGGFFIDLERAHALGDDECIEGSVVTINSEDGLLGTPVREETVLTFDMLFEPRLLIGQKLTLQSRTERNFNGDYKVISLHHRGTISEGVGGQCMTSVGLWYGPKILKVVK